MQSRDRTTFEEHGRTSDRMIDDLRARLAEVQAVEARLQTEVGRFFVSASQLGSSISREPIVGAIREIIANLIGSEEVVILSTVTPPSTTTPAILYSWTGEADWNVWSEVDRAPVEEVLRTGRSFYREASTSAPEDAPPPRDSSLSACIAMRAGDRIVGAVPIFNLLPQKEGLTSSDRDLCEMVGTLGGQALYCSELHESFGGVPTRNRN